MAGKGFPPRPTHLRALEGVRESRLNRDEPLPGDSLIIPPVRLSKAAQAIWNRLAPDLIEKVLTAWDVDEFANACRIQAMLNRALNDAERKPLVTAGSNDNLIMNPAIRIVTSLEATLRTIWSRFGLTPGDRAQLKVDHNGGQKSGAEAYIVEPCGWGSNPADQHECTERGDHFCEPRADHVCGFFENLLVHTKGKHARKRFLLRDWQRDGILRPLFGSVVWSGEHEAYVRQYRIAYVELARKNGKSQILAGIMLYLLFADGEESAEIFSVAKDRNQASAVFDVASRMVLLQPVLSRGAKPIPSTKRIVRFENNGVYKVIASDAPSALGSNPSAVAADEILAWPKADIWDALRSGMGSMDRMQPLLVAATTAPGGDESFGADMHREMVRIKEDPDRAPHVFTYILNLPLDADIYDERNWHIPNPALGDFLSLEEMRKLALEARNDPVRELAFRRFQLNQTLSSEVHWMPMHLWDETAGTVFQNAPATLDAFAGRECWMGIDLAGRQDLTSVCYVFPDDDGHACDVVWRFWLPRAAFERLNKANDGKLAQWVKDGWLEVTDGEVLDLKSETSPVYQAIDQDAQRFTVLGIDADRWSADGVLQEIGYRTYIADDDIMSYTNDFVHMSGGMHRVYEMVIERQFRHHDNPVARWCFDCCEAKLHTTDPDLIMPNKIKRDQSSNRIDAVAAAIMAVNAWEGRGKEIDSVYNKDSLLII